MLKLCRNLFLSLTFFLSSSGLAQAVGAAAKTAEGAEASVVDEHHAAFILLALAGILVAAKILHLIEKIKLPPVVGELIAGIFLGNLALVGFPFFSQFQGNEIIAFLAEMGVIILLFQIGLESNVGQLVKVGVTSSLVAVLGAFIPFLAATYVVGPLLLPGETTATYLFLGAALAATSVGITARIFKDLGLLQSKASQIVLGAAVLDDVLALIILAVISSLATEGSVTPIAIGFIVAKSFLFLLLSVVIGQLLAPYISRAFSMINTGTGTKFTLAISFGLVFAAIADFIGLEAILGAFAAGLVLDPVHFKRFSEPSWIGSIRGHLENIAPASRSKVSELLLHHSERSIDEIIEPLALFFVPIFFVTTGMSVNLANLVSPQTIITSILITIVAVLGKIVSGFVVPGKDKWTVGLAMIPRGEVGLIFAAIGQTMGVVTPQVFSIIVLTVLLTTIVGPFMLARNLKPALAT
jgi:Kef-type K+ transport system membrane component KefB